MSSVAQAGEFAPLVFGLGLSALLLAVGHWLPWPRRLHRLAAYAYGVAALLAGQLLWLGWGRVWAGLVAFALAGGAATTGCYLYDYVLNLRARVAAPERHD